MSLNFQKIPINSPDKVPMESFWKCTGNVPSICNPDQLEFLKLKMVTTLNTNKTFKFSQI